MSGGRMRGLREKQAEALIDAHLRERGWDLTDFTVTERGFKLPSGREADYVFKYKGKVVAILEAKRPGIPLPAALDQARGYAEELMDLGLDVPLIFASDGYVWMRQHLAAHTLWEPVELFPTPAEFRSFFNPQVKTLLADLRSYQRAAVSQAYASICSGRRRMYLQMATGTGKTLTAAAIIAKLFHERKGRRFLFLVDRDALAQQTVRSFSHVLGDNLGVVRLTGERRERSADVFVSTIQHLASGDRYRTWPSDYVDVIFLDECHRSYFGEWHDVIEHFRSAGAVIIGLTATPSDKETINTDRYFTDEGSPRGPVFRYTFHQGVEDGILADAQHYKFFTNVDLHGVHYMGFDFEPEALGRTVDVPQRNELIAAKYFEIIGSNQPIKTIAFAASIAHANNLRYALIREYNRRNLLPPNDATAEDFIVAIHNQSLRAREHIQEFQRISGRITIAVGVGMLDTGIDAPDVEVLLMARPTKSKVLYVQMKGRGTRKCLETGKERFTLVDFVDIARVEELVTDETPGVNDFDEERDRRRALRPRPGADASDSSTTSDLLADSDDAATQPQQMIIADVPVWVEVSEVIRPQDLHAITQQIEAQLPRAWEREGQKERLRQAVAAWRYFRGEVAVEPRYLEAMGFDVETLRDLYGEVSASVDEFVAVAEGRTSFEVLRQRTGLQAFARKRDLTDEQTQLLTMLVDFLQMNSRLSGAQLLRSQWLHSRGGARTVERLFGSLKQYMELGREALTAETGMKDGE